MFYLKIVKTGDNIVVVTESVLGVQDVVFVNDIVTNVVLT